MNKKKVSFSQIILVVSLVILCIGIILPFCWALSTSLRRPIDSFKMPPSFLPTSFMWENYSAVFTLFPFGKFIRNSLFVSVISVVLNIFVTTTAAFAFARIDFKYKNALFLLILSGIMIPAQAIMIPLFMIMTKVKLVGSLWALILPAMISPMSIFLMRQFMMTIPKSYDEATLIDGGSKFTIYFRIILPMSKPVILMTVIQCFLATWNNYMGPLIYLSDWDSMTLPIGLQALRGYMGVGNISQILAGVTISLIAPLLIYIFGQRYLVEGVALSGVKS